MSDRRQFRLPGADESHLNSLGRHWEGLVFAGRRWLIIYSFPIPVGFVQTMSDIAIEIVGGYPPAPLDMAYFSPALTMPSGRIIAQTNVIEQIDGKSWQRWSRHRTPQNPWVLGEDTLVTHLDYVTGWLTEELLRGR